MVRKELLKDIDDKETELNALYEALDEFDNSNSINTLQQVANKVFISKSAPYKLISYSDINSNDKVHSEILEIDDDCVDMYSGVDSSIIDDELEDLQEISVYEFEMIKGLIDTLYLNVFNAAESLVNNDIS